MSTTPPPGGQPPEDPNAGQGWSSPPPGSWSTSPPAQPPYGGGYGQPTYGGGGPVGPPPQNYLVWAILTTVFCCLPFGIASIVFAAQVNGKWQAGDAAGAQRSSDMAKKWAIAAAVTGLVLNVVGLGLFFASIAATVSSS